MKKFLFILSAINLSFSHAYTAPLKINFGEVSGIVIDKDLKQPLPYVTIIINDLDGKLMSGISTLEDGTFTIKEIPPGKYLFQAQFIGYTTYSKEIEISTSRSILEIGTIALEANVALLDDINIIAERSTIEQKIDRKVINVGKDLTTAGASAADIMGNLPTVTVDQDGNIAMRGNDNVRILVDGKPTNIPASQLLKQIPSTSIKSIELITNPSAKYNPEGMSGIINIILHKNSNLGFNANINTGATVGKNTRANGSLDMNYRVGKFNVFANAGANFGKREMTGTIFTLNNNSREVIHFINDNNSYLYKLGVDYYLDDNNSLSFYTNQNKYFGKPFGDINIFYLDDPSSNITQKVELDTESLSSTYNFDYKHEFKKEGHNIELEANYNVVDGSEFAKFNFMGGEGNFSNYQDNVYKDNSNTSVNLDYINPLNDKSKLEMGLETRQRNSNNKYKSTNPNLGDTEYDYDNSIYSFYTTFGQNFEKWSYQLGARLEQYNVEAVLNGNKIFEDDYLTVYPTAYVTYQVSEKKSLQLNYGRRVDRPSLGQVNPVREFSTPRITITGNPQLKPQFTNSVEFNYTQNFEKGSFTGGAFYRIINNEINQTILEDPEDPSRLLLTSINGDDNSSYGLELSGSYKPFKWWSIAPSFEIYNRNTRGVIGTESIEVKDNAFNFRVSNNFKATDALSFQVFGYYRSPSKELQFKAQEMYFINAGARYNLWSDKATLSLNFTDIFNTQRFTFETEFPYKQSGNFKPESQAVYLGFSYKFGGGKNGALKRKSRDVNEKGGGGLF